MTKPVIINSDDGSYVPESLLQQLDSEIGPEAIGLLLFSLTQQAVACMGGYIFSSSPLTSNHRFHCLPVKVSAGGQGVCEQFPGGLALRASVAAMVLNTRLKVGC